MRGKFITFEGIEGVGKSTQLKHLALRLAAAGHELVVTREPGGTPLAERIRAIVLEAGVEPMPAAGELLLMFAARAVHTANLIRPALERGAWVLCDRYTDATFAYQGAGRGVAHSAIAALAALAQAGLEPDLTLLLDAPVAVGLARARRRAGRADRIESETEEFFERVQAGYRQRLLSEPRRLRLVDATGEEAAVAEAVWREVAPLAGGHA